jgi:hypothetical protein
MQDGDNGPEVVWQLSSIEAGSRVEGLAVRCTDEVGRPAVGGVRGKFKVGGGREGLVFSHRGNERCSSACWGTA